MEHVSRYRLRIRICHVPSILQYGHLEVSCYQCLMTHFQIAVEPIVYQLTGFDKTMFTILQATLEVSMYELAGELVSGWWHKFVCGFAVSY